MAEEIPEELEDKITAVAQSIVSLGFSFIKDADKFCSEFKTVVGSGLQNPSFRYLTQLLFDATGEDIELKDPQTFVKSLQDYLQNTGYYIPIDSFLKDGKIGLNNIERN